MAGAAVDALRLALSGGDPVAARAAVAELERVGPARTTRIGTDGPTGPSPEVLDRIDSLVHDLDGTGGAEPGAARPGAGRPHLRAAGRAARGGGMGLRDGRGEPLPPPAPAHRAPGRADPPDRAARPAAAGGRTGGRHGGHRLGRPAHRPQGTGDPEPLPGLRRPPADGRATVARRIGGAVGVARVRPVAAPARGRHLAAARGRARAPGRGARHRRCCGPARGPRAGHASDPDDDPDRALHAPVAREGFAVWETSPAGAGAPRRLVVLAAADGTPRRAGGAGATAAPRSRPWPLPDARGRPAPPGPAARRGGRPAADPRRRADGPAAPGRRGCCCPTVSRRPGPRDARSRTGTLRPQRWSDPRGHRGKDDR